MQTKVDYSVVTPICNEEETIQKLWRRSTNVFQHIDGWFEVIFINDGSIDGSLKILSELNKQHSETKIISLSRNFGHQCILSAGIDYAQGQAVIIMDGDLQDSPDTIITFIEK